MTGKRSLRRQALAALGLSLLLASAGLAQTAATQQEAFDAGLAAFERSDFSEAFTQWQPLAEAGLANAQLGLGVLYYDGLGVAQDDELAAEWFQRAATAGNAEAQYNLGQMYYSGGVLPQDYSEAREWYQRAVDQGHPEASYYLGTLYAGGLGIAEDDVQAFVRFSIAATESGDPTIRALAESNRTLIAQRLNPQELRRAEALVAEAGQTAPATVAEAPSADEQAPSAAYDDGLIAFNRGDYAAALEIWSPAASQGDANSQLGIAVIYHDGLGIDQDFAAAAEWFGRAAEQGLAEAQFNLGVLYYSGRGVARDPGVAADWYARAGDQGHAESNYYLGTMFAAGLGVDQDNVEAYRRFGLAIDESTDASALALNRLAVQGREAVARRLTAEDRRRLPDAEAPLTLPPAATEQAVVVRPQPEADPVAPPREPTTDADGETTVADLEAAAAEARTSNATKQAEEARVAELEVALAAAQERRDQASAALTEAGQQDTDFQRGLAQETRAQQEAEADLRAAREAATDAQRDLAEQRRRVEVANEQAQRVAAELRELEERRQEILRRQAATESALAEAQADTEQHEGALAEQQTAIEVAQGALQAAAARVQSLRDRQAAELARRDAAEETVREADGVVEARQRELAAARAAASAATAAATAAQQRLAAATQAYSQAIIGGGSRPAQRAPEAVPAGPGEPGEPSQQLVARVQRALASLGYEPGQADGVLGQRTLTALEQFQADKGLPVTGRVTEELAFSLDILASAGAPAQTQLSLGGSGTGFIVAGDGHVVTNHHVVEGCAEVRVQYGGQTYVAPHLSSDEQNDLALLNTAIQTEDFVAFRAGRAVRPGDDVVALGFPLQGRLSDQVKVTRGTISALSGPDNNRTLLQTTAPVQPGSSGGPLLDLSGNAVGVVMGKISSVEVENVSFAVKAAIARIFLDAEGVNYRSRPSEDGRSAADVAESARHYTVLVECWNRQ